MCGIVGFVGPDNARVARDMNTCLTHRGPDGVGVYDDPEAAVSLAMRRLAIIDLETGGQPMSTADQRTWVVHNGEIYNAPELRAELERAGAAFRTRNADTEVLLHLYARRGRAMVHALNGMFSFVILDRDRGQLFGARDRIGIKPLYYAHRSGDFAFASELKALLRIPGIRREIDPASLSHYLSLRYVPGAQTIFSDIGRLPAGHTFTYDIASGRLRIERYWDVKFEPDLSVPAAEWPERLREALRQAVRRWSLSDVPIACSLSGGIDSPAIVGLLREVGQTDIHTYTVGFTGAGEERWNELPAARLVAQQWETDHHEFALSSDALLDDLVDMVWHLDEPYAGGLPSWYVFKLMSADVKVGLTGTGGDELFGNYGKWIPFERSRSHSIAAAYRRILGDDGIPIRIAASALGAIAGSWPGADPRRVGRIRDLPTAVSDPLRWHYLDPSFAFRDGEKSAVLREGRGGGSTLEHMSRVRAAAGALNERDGIAYLDMHTQLPDEFLFMTDRFSMAHSLEARVPYLDHELVELVARVPADVRTDPSDPKALLKRAVANLLPSELLTTPKHGFVVPTTMWLRGSLRPLAERLLGSEYLGRQGIFRSDLYERLVEPHLSGRIDRADQVWTLLMFQLWHTVFVERGAYERPSFSWRDLC